jgi:hypothetical protein
MLLRPRPHQELARLFMRLLSPADRRGAVRVTRWNPLCDGKAQREEVKKTQTHTQAQAQ